MGSRMAFWEDLEKKHICSTFCHSDFSKLLSGEWLELAAKLGFPNQLTVLPFYPLLVIFWFLKKVNTSFIFFIHFCCFLVSSRSVRYGPCPAGAHGPVARANHETLHLFGDKPIMAPSWVGCRLSGDMDHVLKVPCVPCGVQRHVGPLAGAQWPWWLISLTATSFSMEILVPWCLGVWKQRFFLFPGMRGLLWEVLFSPLVKVLWKPEPEAMAEEVPSWSEELGCWLPFSRLALSRLGESCAVVGWVHVWRCGWVLPGLSNPDAHSGAKFSVCSAVYKPCVLASFFFPGDICCTGSDSPWENGALSVSPLQHTTNKTGWHCLEKDGWLEASQNGTTAYWGWPWSITGVPQWRQELCWSSFFMPPGAAFVPSFSRFFSE